MSTRSMLHQAKLNEWANRLSDQKASGLSVIEWCEQNNLSKYQYFYWRHQLKEETLEQALPEISPLAMPSASSPTQVIPASSEVARESCASCATFAPNSNTRILINGISIEIDSSAPEAFIRSIIRAILSIIFALLSHIFLKSHLLILDSLSTNNSLTICEA